MDREGNSLPIRRLLGCNVDTPCTAAITMLIPASEALSRASRPTIRYICRDTDPCVAMRAEDALGVEHACVGVLGKKSGAGFCRGRSALVCITVCVSCICREGRIGTGWMNGWGLGRSGARSATEHRETQRENTG